MMGLLIWMTEILYGTAATAELTRLDAGVEPGMADSSAMVDALGWVTLMKPCWPLARPVDWKRVVRRAELLVSCCNFWTL